MPPRAGLVRPGSTLGLRGFVDAFGRRRERFLRAALE